MVRELYKRGYEEQQIRELFRFIDWVMALPKELERDFRQEVHKIEEDRRMRYVTSIERLAREEGVEEGIEKGIEKGVEKGVEKGMISVLKRQLTRRFGDLPRRILALLEKASPAELERWIDRVLDARSLDEVFATP